MNNYTLREIKDELNREIQELEDIDPNWKNCRNCPLHGKCCIGNDIDIRDDEWEEIKHRLDENPFLQSQVKANFDSDSLCYFRTESRCLIHDIRPTNCLYTPYQVIQNLDDHKLTYSLRNSTCDFETETEDSLPLPEEKYLLPIPKTGHTYLLLNYWYRNFEEKSLGNFKEEARYRLQDYFEKRQKRNYYGTYHSPLGTIKMVSDGNSLNKLCFLDNKNVFETIKESENQSFPLFQKVTSWLESYFQGKPIPIDFSLNPSGTDFQRTVWSFTMTVPFGSTASYQDIAEKFHRPMSNQAIGQALSANPIILLIPCHRIIRSDGGLGGFSCGIEKKKFLLHFEKECVSS